MDHISMYHEHSYPKSIYGKWIKGKKYLVVELHRLDLSIACPVSICFATRKNGDDKIKNIKYVEKKTDSNFRQSHIPGSKRKRVFHAVNAFKEYLTYFFKCNFAIYHKKQFVEGQESEIKVGGNPSMKNKVYLML